MDFDNLTIAVPILPARHRRGGGRFTRKEILATAGGVAPSTVAAAATPPPANVSVPTEPPPTEPEPLPVDAATKTEDPVTMQVDRAAIPQDARKDIMDNNSGGAAATDDASADAAPADPTDNSKARQQGGDELTPEQQQQLASNRQVFYQAVVHRMQPDMTDIPVAYMTRLFGMRSKLKPHLDLFDKLSHRFRLVPHQLRDDDWGKPEQHGSTGIRQEYERRLLWHGWYNKVLDKLKELRETSFQTKPKLDANGVPDMSAGFQDPIPDYLNVGGALERKLEQVVTNLGTNKVPHTTRRALKDLYASLEFYKKMRERMAAVERGQTKQHNLTPQQLRERLRENYAKASNPKIPPEEREKAVQDSLEHAPPRHNIAANLKGKSKKHDAFNAIVPMNNRAMNQRGGPATNSGQDSAELSRIRDGFEKMVEKKLLSMSEKLEQAVGEKTKNVVDAMDEKTAAMQQGKALRKLSEWPLVLDQMSQMTSARDFESAIGRLQKFHESYKNLDRKARTSMMPLIQPRVEEDLMAMSNQLMSTIKKERAEKSNVLAAIDFARDKTNEIVELARANDMTNEEAMQQIHWVHQAIENSVGQVPEVAEALNAPSLEEVVVKLDTAREDVNGSIIELQNLQHRFVQTVTEIENDVVGHMESFDANRAVAEILQLNQPPRPFAAAAYEPMAISGPPPPPAFFPLNAMNAPPPRIAPDPDLPSFRPTSPLLMPAPGPAENLIRIAPNQNLPAYHPTTMPPEPLPRAPTPAGQFRPIVSTLDEIEAPHPGRSGLEKTWDETYGKEAIHDMSHYERVLAEHHGEDFLRRARKSISPAIKDHSLNEAAYVTPYHHEPVQFVPVHVTTVPLPPALPQPPAVVAANTDPHSRLALLNKSLSARFKPYQERQHDRLQRLYGSVPVINRGNVPGSKFTPASAIKTDIPNRLPNEELEQVSQENTVAIQNALQTIDAANQMAARDPNPEDNEVEAIIATNNQAATKQRMLSTAARQQIIDNIRGRTRDLHKYRDPDEPPIKSPRADDFASADEDADNEDGEGLTIVNHSSHEPYYHNTTYLVHNVPSHHIRRGGGVETMHKMWIGNRNPIVRGMPPVFMRQVVPYSHGGELGTYTDPITRRPAKMLGADGHGCGCPLAKRHGGGGTIDWKATHALDARAADEHEQWGGAALHPDSYPKQGILQTLSLYIYNFPDEFIHPDEMLLLSNYKQFQAELPLPEIFQSIWFDYILVIFEMADRVRNTNQITDTLPRLKPNDDSQFSAKVQIPDLVDGSEWPVSSITHWPKLGDDGDLATQISAIMADYDPDSAYINKEQLQAILLGDAEPLTGLEAREAVALGLIAHHYQMKYIPMFI